MVLNTSLRRILGGSAFRRPGGFLPRDRSSPIHAIAAALAVTTKTIEKNVT
jgi:hypothetical protein